MTKEHKETIQNMNEKHDQALKSMIKENEEAIASLQDKHDAAISGLT